MFRAQKDELELSNRWAEELNTLLVARGARIDELQEELARDQQNARQVVADYNAKIAALRKNCEKAQWAIDTETRLTAEIGQNRRRAEDRQRQPGADRKGSARAHRLGSTSGRRETPTRRPAEYGARLPMDQAGAQGRPRPRALTWLS